MEDANASTTISRHIRTYAEDAQDRAMAPDASA